MAPRKYSFKREFWRPGERKIWAPKQPRFGWGRTLDFAELNRRLRRRR
jgi:hypothetical protein